MTIRELESVVAHHGLSINGYRGGAGKFRDLEIGVGATALQLAAFVADIKARGHTLVSVTNTDHKDCGKAYAEVGSFWWE